MSEAVCGEAKTADATVHVVDTALVPKERGGPGTSAHHTVPRPPEEQEDVEPPEEQKDAGPPLAPSPPEGGGSSDRARPQVVQDRAGRPRARGQRALDRTGRPVVPAHVPAG